MDHVVNTQGVSITSIVADFVREDGSWDSPLICSYLPMQVALQVLGMSPPVASLGPDSMVWGLESSGRFSIQSAYLLLKELQEETPDKRWQGVWRWQGPNKIRHFLWMASHNRILTNEERGRRHLTTQVGCSICPTVTESCLHVLRDCGFAKQVWSRFFPTVIAANELVKDHSGWLDDHIRHSDLTHSISFGVGVWLLWRVRNKRLFEQDILTAEKVAHRCDYWVALISLSWKTGQLGREVQSSTRQAQLIGWRPGDEGAPLLRLLQQAVLFVQIVVALLKPLRQIWRAALLLVPS
ncbi:Putative ribonuclease H protein At1g65750 [Linum grandiflorum]